MDFLVTCARKNVLFRADGNEEYWVDPNENTHQVNMFVQAISQGVYSLIGVYHFTENETDEPG